MVDMVKTSSFFGVDLLLASVLAFGVTQSNGVCLQWEILDYSVKNEKSNVNVKNNISEIKVLNFHFRVLVLFSFFDACLKIEVLF